MKIVKLFIASVCFTVLASACVKNLAEGPDVQPVNDSRNLTTITCEFPTMTDQNGTKVSLTEAGETGWQEGDKIVIYGKRRNASPDHPELDKVIHTLTAAEVSDPTKAVFTVDLSGLEEDPAGIHPYNAMYPADETDEYLPFYSQWGSSGRTRFKDTNKMLMAGYLDGGVMSLQNLCAAITFKVSGDFDTYYFSGYAGTETVGYGQYLVELNNTENPGGVYNRKPGEEWGTKNPMTTISGPVNGNGSSLNYIFIPIEANLPYGFTITFAKSGVKLKTISTQTALSLDRAEMVNLGLLPGDKLKDYELIPASEKATATDLSDIAPSKSANCYIVSAEGTTNDNKVFKFPTVKGNSFVKGTSAGTSIGTVVSADILWETWNTSTTPTAKQIIRDVEYKDGFIYFKTAADMHAGNVVIAARDSGGNILWSWHIWVPASNVGSGTYEIATRALQDRNLGALNVSSASSADITAAGLLYQWGRKDPFLNKKNSSSSDNDFAYHALESSISVNQTMSSTKFASVEASLKQPTVLVGSGEGSDWLSTSDNALWGASKTIYDPCPAGYKVPTTSESVMFTENITAGDYTAWSYNSTTFNCTIGKTGDGKFTVFPFGYLYANGRYDKVHERTLIWSATTSSDPGVSKALYIYSGGYGQYSHGRATGGQIRCIAEPTE